MTSPKKKFTKEPGYKKVIKDMTIVLKIHVFFLLLMVTDRL